MVRFLGTAARALGIAALLALAACYETDREVIPAGLAEAIPYRGNPIEWPDGARTWIEPVPFSKDYRFEDHRDNEVKAGTLRALRIVRDIFAVQLRYDGEANYDLLFYRITANRIGQVETTTPPAEIQSLAARFRVTADDDGLGTVNLSGASADLLAFIRAHSRLAFRDAK